MQHISDALRLYVLWAPPAPHAVTVGSRLAAEFGDRLDAVGMVRDGIGLRIPVRQRSIAWRPQSDAVTPRPIELEDAHSNVLVVVYDDVMDSRPQWWRYLGDLERAAAARGGKDLLILLLMTSANQPPKAWASIQAIRCKAPADQSAADPSDWQNWSRRMMLDTLALAVGRAWSPAPAGPKKICVFLSHAKADGEDAALLIEGLRRLKPGERINSIDMYFDSSDTLAGAGYESQFRGAIEQGVFLALVTDAYHTRRWCHWELLLAKQRQRPIIVWDRSVKGISRSFPYLGNVPVVRTKDVGSTVPPADIDIENLLLALLLEALRMVVWTHYAGERVGTAASADGGIAFFARPPELVEIAYHLHTGGAKVIVYPDPPVSQDERELLSAAYPGLKLLALSEALG